METFHKQVLCHYDIGGGKTQLIASFVGNKPPEVIWYLTFTYIALSSCQYIECQSFLLHSGLAEAV
jgi:hypothetical protein